MKLNFPRHHYHLPPCHTSPVQPDTRTWRRSGRTEPRAGLRWGACKQVGLFLVFIAIASCSNQTAKVDELIESARTEFFAFDFEAARDGFAEALEKDSKSADAAYGHARALAELSQYEEAIPAFELALELAPNNPRVQEGYVDALAWGGRLRGRRDWLERAVAAGTETILAFPDRVQAYKMAAMAVYDLSGSGRWSEILGAYERRLASSFVFRIYHLQARLSAARTTGDEEAATIIEDELRHALATVIAAEESAVEREEPPDERRWYFLAVGYKLLGDTEAQRSWLERLDETPEGRLVGSEQTSNDIFYQEYLQSREAPWAERMEIVKRWKVRFQPSWDNDYFTAFRGALAQERSLLIEEARRQRDEDGQLDDAVLDRVIEISHDLARLDTWRGISHYRTAAQLLIDLEVRLDGALRIADEAIVALKEERPGLLHPGTHVDQVDRTREDWIATYEYVRGLALVKMERVAEAGQAFRSAIDVRPSSDRLAALGELLAASGPDEEAYEVLVAALAHDAEDELLGMEADRIHEVAAQVAARFGRDAEALDDTLVVVRADVVDAARQRLVDNRLEREAPDFSLTDTQGNQWRLSDLHGKVVILNYWATWCVPCIQELPYYRDLVDEYASHDDVEFFAITTDDDHDAAREFLDKHDYRFTVLFDESSATDFQVAGIPAHFILGPEGLIQYEATGFPSAERYADEMRWMIDALRQE